MGIDLPRLAWNRSPGNGCLVAGAFHTPIMQSAVEKLADALRAVEIKESRIAVYSNVDARPHTSPAEFRELLVQQVCSPVLWHDSMQQMLDALTAQAASALENAQLYERVAKARQKPIRDAATSTLAEMEPRR